MASIAIDDAAWGSPWRHHHVGEKLLWSFALILTALAAPVQPGTILVGIISCIIILGPARIRPTMLLGAMTAPFIFIIFGAISVLFSIGVSPVDAYWQWGWFSITPASVAMAASLFIHALAGSLAVMVFALTTPISDLLNWMVKHKVPGPLVEIAALTYRMLFILWGTAVNLHDAQIRRGAVMTLRSWRGFKLWLNGAADAVGTLMVRAWDKARRLEAGLAARGAEDSLATTIRPAPRSWPLLASCLVTIVAIWLISWGWPTGWRIS